MYLQTIMQCKFRLYLLLLWQIGGQVKFKITQQLSLVCLFVQLPAKFAERLFFLVAASALLPHVFSTLSGGAGADADDNPNHCTVVEDVTQQKAQFFHFWGGTGAISGGGSFLSWLTAAVVVAFSEKRNGQRNPLSQNPSRARTDRPTETHAVSLSQSKHRLAAFG